MGPVTRDDGTRYARLLKAIKSDPSSTYDQLRQRGFCRSMVKRARKELGLGRPGWTPYVSRREMAGKDVPGRAEPFNHEPGRSRQGRWRNG